MKAYEIKAQLFWLEESVNSNSQKEMVGNIYSLINSYEKEILKLRKQLWDKETIQLMAIQQLGGVLSAGHMIEREISKKNIYRLKMFLKLRFV